MTELRREAAEVIGEVESRAMTAWTKEPPSNDGWFWLRQSPNLEPFVREIIQDTRDGVLVVVNGEWRPWNDRTEHWPVRIEEPPQ